jgi:hypothetical protein
MTGWDSVEVIEEGLEQPVQSGACEFHLGLDARNSKRPEFRCSIDRRIEQHGLSHAGISEKHPRAGATVPGRINGLDQPAQFVGPTDDSH